MYHDLKYNIKSPFTCSWRQLLLLHAATLVSANWFHNLRIKAQFTTLSTLETLLTLHFDRILVGSLHDAARNAVQVQRSVNGSPAPGNIQHVVLTNKHVQRQPTWCESRHQKRTCCKVRQSKMSFRVIKSTAYTAGNWEFLGSLIWPTLVVLQESSAHVSVNSVRLYKVRFGLTLLTIKLDWHWRTQSQSSHEKPIHILSRRSQLIFYGHALITPRP